MGWYAHPDTLCNAQAEAAANKTSYERDSVEWLQAYRDAYQAIAGENAKDYIQKLDAKLSAKKCQQ